MTPGIFRRSAGVKACRELKEKLDSGYHERPLNEESVFVTAAVFKVNLCRKPTHLKKGASRSQTGVCEPLVVDEGIAGAS